MPCESDLDLNKNHGKRRDFCLIYKSKLVCGFYQCANAASAQHFADFSTILINRNRLQIRFKLAVGRSHRKAAVMTKGRCLSTFFTLCHNKDPFNYECFDSPAFALHSNQVFYHTPYLFTRKVLSERGITA